MNRRTLTLLLAGVILAAPTWAAGTQIVDTLRYRAIDPSAGNDLANCTLFIKDATPSSDAHSTYTPATLPYKVTNGVVNITLQPNDASAPAGTSYSVQYSCAKGKPYSEVWVVPTGGPFRIQDVRAATVPSPSTQISPYQLAGSGAIPGPCLGWNGTSWQPVGCGSSSGGLTISDQETPAGTMDGTNAAFTLIAAPSPASSLMLFRNGVAQKAGSDYGLVGNVVTFTAPSIPQSDDVLLAWYRYGSNQTNVSFSDQESPSGSVDGANTVFVLSSTPSPVNGLVLFRNGIAQKRGFDYNVTGNTITFVGAATPQEGDTLLAWYRY